MFARCTGRAAAGSSHSCRRPHQAEDDPCRTRRTSGGVAPEPIDSNLSPLKRASARRGALGLATDGDADASARSTSGASLTCTKWCRCSCSTSRVGAASGGVVRTFSQSVLLKRIAAAHGLALYETPIGFKYVADLMLREKILLGAEESGGIGLAGHLPERDGILNSLLFLEAVVADGRAPSEMVREMHREFGEFYLTAATSTRMSRAASARRLARRHRRRRSPAHAVRSSKRSTATNSSSTTILAPLPTRAPSCPPRLRRAPPSPSAKRPDRGRVRSRHRLKAGVNPRVAASECSPDFQAGKERLKEARRVSAPDVRLMLADATPKLIRLSPALKGGYIHSRYAATAVANLLA